MAPECESTLEGPLPKTGQICKLVLSRVGGGQQLQSNMLVRFGGLEGYTLAPQPSHDNCEVKEDNPKQQLNSSRRPMDIDPYLSRSL